MKKYLQKLLWKYALRLTSAFNTPSLLKSRIVMLYQKPSARFAVAKFGFALPMLLLCMFVTAFTQRERILPTSLVQEVDNVAQKLVGEAKKAFLPAIESEQTKTEKEDEETKEAIKETEKTVEKAKSMSALPTKSTTESPDFLTLVPAQVVAMPETVQPKRSVIATDYTFLKNYHLRTTTDAQRFSYIFTKNNHYILQVIDAKSKAPIVGSKVKVSVFAKQDNNLLPVVLEEVAEGFTFQCGATGLFELVFENPDKVDCLAVQLSFQKGFGSYKANTTSLPVGEKAEIFLADKEGKEVNYKKKISVKNSLQLLFADKEQSKNYQIKTVGVTHFRKGKAMGSQTFDNGSLSFADLKIKRGDAVQITVMTVVNSKTNENVKIARPYIAFFAK